MKTGAAVSFLLMIILLPLNAGQRQPYSLSVDVDFVVMNVRVTDKDGESIHGLSKDAFEVQENGKRQDIGLFIGEDSPAAIGIVLDGSASMNSKYVQVRAAALRFIQATRSGDEVFVLHFNERLHWPLPPTQPFTDDVRLLEQTLAWNQLGGKTVLYDAVTAALRECERSKSEKRALVVLSDGGDNASRQTLDQVLRLAQQSNVTIYAIGLFDPLAVDTSQSVLRKLTTQTGGELYLPKTLDELAPVWDAIAHGIRTQYTIGYRPNQTSFDGKFHKVRVRVQAPGRDKVRVHTRPGYMARNTEVEP
jgi:Ca-activated chloride channel family protein